MGVDRFLVVEDDAAVARAVGRLLQSYGEIHVAPTLADAMRALETSIVWTGMFVDLGLPDGSGFDVVERSKELKLDIPALVLTGREDAASVNRAFDLGAQYVCKPVAADRLTCFVRACQQRAARSRGNAGAVVDAWSIRYRFTETEGALFRHAVDGVARRDLALHLEIAPETAKKHVRNLLNKTGDPSLHAAVHRASRWNHNRGDAPPLVEVRVGAAA
jgi:two-component system response regulator DevR